MYAGVYEQSREKIACYTCVSLSLSLTIICPKIAQYDQFSANHCRRPITNFFSLSLSFYRNFLAFSSQLSIRTERAKEKREESDNGSLSHIIFSYEYFIQECKHTAREKEEKKEFQSSLRLFSSSECLLVFLSISNHWARCRQRKSHNVYSNKMKWTHTQKWQIHYIAFVSIILRTIHFHIDTLSDYTKKVLSIWKGGWGERKKIKEDEYDRKRFVF